VSDAPFTFDEAFVDVGAGSAAQVAGLGIEVLSMVTRAKAPQRYGDSLLAAPVAGRRAACAALLRASQQARPPRGSVVIAFVVEQNFTGRGIRTVARTLGPFTDAVLLDATSATTPDSRPPSPDPTYLANVEVWGLPVRYAGTPVETVSLAAAARMERGLVVRIGGGE
jgi:putative aminopeptidase FrvX